MRKKIDIRNVGNTKIISNSRSFMSQCSAFGALSLMIIIDGVNLGFPTILIPALRNSTEINVTISDISWISSVMCLSLPVGFATSGVYADYFGRRFGIIIMGIPTFVSWIIFHFANNMPEILFALMVLSIASGMMEGPGLMYVSEISETKFRSGLLASTITLVYAGMFLVILVGSFVYWRTLVVINAIFTVLGMFLLYWVPESPYWLTSKTKFDEAKNALAWLRGWTTISNVTEEFCILVETFQNDKSSETTVNCDSNIEVKGLRNSIKSSLQRSFYVPFMLVAFMFFVHAFSGNLSILTFSVIIFQDMDTPMNPYIVSTIMGLFNLLGTVLCIISIPSLGKRKVCFITSIVSGISFFVTSIYMWVYHQGHVADNNLTWIPVIFLTLAIFCSAGFNTVPWVLVGEVFPASLRGIGSGISITLFYMFAWGINMGYLYLVREIHYSGSFLFFSVINFVGCIVLFISLPETEGKSLKEIQDYFARDDKKESQNDDNFEHVNNVYFVEN